MLCEADVASFVRVCAILGGGDPDFLTVAIFVGSDPDLRVGVSGLLAAFVVRLVSTFFSSAWTHGPVGQVAVRRGVGHLWPQPVLQVAPVDRAAVVIPGRVAGATAAAASAGPAPRPV